VGQTWAALDRDVGRVRGAAVDEPLARPPLLAGVLACVHRFKWDRSFALGDGHRALNLGVSWAVYHRGASRPLYVLACSLTSRAVWPHGLPFCSVIFHACPCVHKHGEAHRFALRAPRLRA
jgi:hypothetical protein